MTAGSAPVVGGALRADDLRHVALFAGLDDPQYEWLASAATHQTLGDGEVLFRDGDAARAFYVLLGGELVITKVVDGREEVLTRHSTGGDEARAHEGKPGAAHGFTGELPLLTGDPYVATATVVGGAKVACYGKDAFSEMLVRCPQVGAVMLPVLAWRIRSSEAQARQRETILALGTLAAGLAHELNNPAAAVARAASELTGALAGLVESAQGWGMVANNSEGTALEDLRRRIGEEGIRRPDALATAAAEEEMSAWLDANGVAEGWRLAAALADRGLDVAVLQGLRASMRPAALRPALAYLDAMVTAEDLTTDIAEAGVRISALVASAKDYTNLDRAAEQDVDLTRGLEATLAMLAPRLSGVTVHRDYHSDLPTVRGYPTELNQVWTNLVDNAVDAMGGSGELWVRTGREGSCVLVEVADDGPGVPGEVLPRIFEPFFTTKDIGKGTGLGLHLSQRIVAQRHRGSLSVRSSPGDTLFTVRLPGSTGSTAPHPPRREDP